MTNEEAKEIIIKERDSSKANPIVKVEDCLYEALDMAIKALEQTRWIPCTERLPKEDGCYLVTIKWKGRYSGDVYTETTMAEYKEKTKEWDYVDVIAWMPLPEPYKAESEDK